MAWPFERRQPRTAGMSAAVAEPEPLPVAGPVNLRLDDLAMESEYQRVAAKLRIVRRPPTAWCICGAKVIAQAKQGACPSCARRFAAAGGKLVAG